MLESIENLKLPLHGVILPEIKIPKSKLKALNLDDSISNFEFLKALSRAGFKEKLGHLKPNTELYKKYVERARHELSLVEELSFTDYFLIVWDVVNFCRDSAVATGLGRGSCCASLLLYLIDVTKIDPIKYGLYFERFISRARAKKTVVDGVTYLDGSLMPDVDLDISYSQRVDVIKYIEEKYSGKTSKILTLNTLSGKLLIKECGKIIDECSEDEMNKVSNMIPKVFGQVMDIEDAYNQVEVFKKWCDAHKDVYEVAKKLRDLIKNKGCHASGYVLADKDLNGIMPLELSSDKHIVSGYDMGWVGKLTVKLDLLGLRAASLMHDVCNLVNIKPEDIDINDKRIYQYLSEVECPHGIFQIEADTNYKVCKKVKPENIEELSDILALARPGALAYVDKYVDIKNGGDYESLHQEIDSLLAQTKYQSLYQETTMKLLNILGFTLEEAEIARRIIGKKKKEEVAEWEEKIFKKAQENKFSKNIAEKIWKLMKESADYSFNKCLSPDSLIIDKNGNYKRLDNVKQGEYILAYDVKNSKDHYVEVVNIYENSVELYEAELEGGKKIKSSLDHKFLTEDRKMLTLREIVYEDLKICHKCSSMLFSKILTVKKLGASRTLDLEVDHEDHNFYAQDIVVSNSHSIAYASLSAITTYLKINYPKEFFLVLLKLSRFEPDSFAEIFKIEREMNLFGIKLLPPHLIKSDIDFKIEGNNIRYGLLSIKGVSDKKMDKINQFRNHYSNRFEVFQAANQAGVDIGLLSALIQAGTLDEDFDNSRCMLTYECQLWSLLTDKEKKLAFAKAEQFNYKLVDIIKYLKTVKTDEGKPIISEKRLVSLKDRSEKYNKIYNFNKRNEKFANWWFETKLLGYSYSHKLENIFKEHDRNIISISECLNLEEDNEVCVVGVVCEVKEFTSKKGTKTLRVSIKDNSNTIVCLLFKDDRIQKHKNENGGKKVEEEEIVIVKGKKKTDCIFADLITVQDRKIYTKLSELN